MENDASVTPERAKLLAELAAVSSEIRRVGQQWGDRARGTEAEICARIRDQRLLSGLSQVEVSIRMSDCGFDMQQSTVAKIEAGKRSLRVAELFAFADIFDVPVMTLLIDPRSGYIEGSVDSPIGVMEGFLAIEEELKTEAEQKLLETVKYLARVYAVHDARSVLLSTQIRKNSAKLQRGETNNESPA